MRNLNQGETTDDAGEDHCHHRHSLHPDHRGTAVVANALRVRWYSRISANVPLKQASIKTDIIIFHFIFFIILS